MAKCDTNRAEDGSLGSNAEQSDEREGSAQSVLNSESSPRPRYLWRSAKLEGNL